MYHDGLAAAVLQNCQQLLAAPSLSTPAVTSLCLSGRFRRPRLTGLVTLSGLALDSLKPTRVVFNPPSPQHEPQHAALPCTAQAGRPAHCA